MVRSDTRVRNPLAPFTMIRALPLLIGIAAVLAIGFMLLRQLGLDSRNIEVVDANTNEVRSYSLVTVLPREAIPAITNPAFVSADQASFWMDEAGGVIGLDIGGDARAYPINMLSRHEIVDDTVGGVAVAVTW